MTATSYRASWSEAPETVDYYVLTRTVYDGSTLTTTEYLIDETSCDFDDLKPGETHTYSVKSSRLGYRSVASNEITVSSAGVTGVAADKGLAVVAYCDGVVRFICSSTQTNCRIFNAYGMLVDVIGTVEPDTLVRLPLGVYLVTTDQCPRPVKVLVRQ